MSEHETDNSEGLGHEPIAVSARGVAMALAVLFAVVVASLLLMTGLNAYLSFTRRVEPGVGAAGTPIAPPPGVPEVDANQTGDLRRLRLQEKEILTEYSWIDRDAGIARIPIRRAMEILSQETTPIREQPNDIRDNQ